MAKSKYNKMTPEQLEAEATALMEKEDRLIAKMTNAKYVVVVTKLSPEAHSKLESICDKEGTTKYEVGQVLFDSYIRFKDPGQVITEEMKQLMIAFGVGVKLDDRICLSDPSVKADIREATLYLGDPSKKGMVLRHVYQPFMGEAEMTDNPTEIWERMAQESHVLYEKLKKAYKVYGVSGVYQLLCKIAESVDGIEDANEIEATFADKERSVFGRRMDELRSKKTQINSMEAFERRQTEIDFDEGLKEIF